ncbi:hypothetical protein NMY22_g12318 [Coprinellus aureogranulatus]|nr:hypothetical protein NMY22_g12318 [Coprinellus aureogranulatus]
MEGFSPRYTAFQDPRLLSLLGVVAALFLISRAISRLYFHPLSRFPGPPLAALTDYYVSYYVIFKSGAWVAQLRTLHEQYGPVVRIGPNKLHFADPNAYDGIYRDNRFPKEPWFYDAWISYTSSFGCTSIKGARERRSIVHPFFSRQNVLHLQHVVQGTVDRFMASLSQHCKEGNVINMHRGFYSISLEVITTFCFAKSYEAIDYPEYGMPFLIAIVDGLIPIFIMQHFPFMRPLIFGLPEWFLKIVAPLSLTFPAFTRRLEEQIDSILADPASLDKVEHETVYHHLLNPKSGKKLTRDELRHEASVIVAAGTDTVGNTCNVALFHCLNDKSIGKRLRGELYDAWPDVDAPMSLEKLEKLPYLTAVIQEALRLSHGVVAPLPRVATETKSIGGYIVPQGTVVAMSQTFMHLNPNLFPEPNKFDPERWLKDGSTELLNYLVPFSKGQRQCIGLNLAWAELYLILGNLFRKVDLEMIDTTEKDLEWKAHLVARFKGSVKAKITRIERSSISRLATLLPSTDLQHLKSLCAALPLAVATTRAVLRGFALRSQSRAVLKAGEMSVFAELAVS